jgi:hypothetical protein
MDTVIVAAGHDEWVPKLLVPSTYDTVISVLSEKRCMFCCISSLCTCKWEAKTYFRKENPHAGIPKKGTAEPIHLFLSNGYLPEGFQDIPARQVLNSIIDWLVGMMYDRILSVQVISLSSGASSAKLYGYNPAEYHQKPMI